MGPRLKTDFCSLTGMEAQLSLPLPPVKMYSTSVTEATTWLENRAQEAYPLEIYLEVDLSLK